MRFVSLIVCFALFSGPAHAAGSPVAAAFSALHTCVLEGNPTACRTRVTADSVEYFDRFVQHGFTECVPKDARVLSRKRQGNTIFVRARSEEAKGIALLGFSEEEGTWELDLPATLAAALGPKWRQKVLLTEQLYVALKHRMGNTLNCEAIRDLAVDATGK